MTIGQHQVSFKKATKIFFTTTASTKSNVPQQLKAVLKNIAISTPEKRALIEVQLTAMGFKSAKLLAIKVNSLITLITNTFYSILKSTTIMHHVFQILKLMCD